MERCRLFYSAALVTLMAAGCSKGDAAKPAAGGEAAVPTAKAASHGTPDQAVTAFLEAVRTGNDEKAATMLTPIARQKTSELGLEVAPRGSDTAKFEVGDVEYVTPEKDGAHVASKWSDMVDGQRQTNEILWILRDEPDGWRIAGMATKVFEDELPVILNFEDPEDMLRKQKMVAEEMQRRASPQNPVAAGTTAPIEQATLPTKSELAPH